MQFDQDGGVCWVSDGSKVWVCFYMFEIKVYFGQWLESCFGVFQNYFDYVLDQYVFDCGVGMVFDVYCRCVVVIVEQNVYDGIDQVGVDCQQVVIVQLLGLEYSQDCWQWD